MPSESSSEQPVAVRENKPFLEFLISIVLVIGAFFVSRKYIGNIPAAIAAYLLYVYRKEIKAEFEDLKNGRA
jgi:hypothetical protein